MNSQGTLIHVLGMNPVLEKYVSPFELVELGRILPKCQIVMPCKQGLCVSQIGHKKDFKCKLEHIDE